MKIKSPPPVGLLLPTNLHYGREVLFGIFDYVRQHRPWRYVTGGLGSEDASLPSHVPLSVVVGMVTAGKLLQSLKKRGIPVVNVSERHSGVGTARVLPDNEAAGRLAAEYFLNKKFTHFAYTGCEDFAFARLRHIGFEERLREAGFSCVAQNFGAGKWPAHSLDPLPEIGRWIESLPKPCAVFAQTDDHARRVLNECDRMGVSVPEEVAVLGCDNDEIECELAPIPISSVAFPLRRLGYEAAAMAERLMEGQPPPAEALRLAPTGIVTRRSTDIIAVKDPVVARAMSFINAHAAEPIHVGDVVRACGASRRYIERRFATLLGRTPKQEIQRTRLQIAKRLLAETLLPMPEVAEASGFSDAKMLSTVFGRAMGMTPSQYRASVRQQGRSS